MNTVIALDALKGMTGCPVWVETRNGKLYSGWALVYEFYSGPSLNYMGSERVGITQPNGHIMWLLACWYGEKWRCWIEAPTEEERKGEAWECSRNG